MPFWGRLIKHSVFAELAGSKHRKRQNPIPLALGDQQFLAAGTDHDPIRKRQFLGDGVADPLTVEVMDRAIGFLFIGAGRVGEVNAARSSVERQVVWAAQRLGRPTRSRRA